MFNLKRLLSCILLISPTNVSAFVPTRNFRIDSSNPSKSNGQKQFFPSEVNSKGSRTLLNLGVEDYVDVKSLSNLFLERLIIDGVPAVCILIVIAFAAKAFKSNKDKKNSFGKNVVDNLYDDLYGGYEPEAPSFFPQKMFGNNGRGNGPSNLGIPKREYLKISKINDVYDSYAFSLTTATQSKAKAAAKLRSKSFDMALQKAFDSSAKEFTSEEKATLLNKEKEFLKEGGSSLQELSELQKELTDLTIRSEMKKMSKDVGGLDLLTANIQEGNVTTGNTTVETGTNVTATEKTKENKPIKFSKTETQLMVDIEKGSTELLKLELRFMRSVVEVMGPERADAIRRALVGNINGGGALVAGGLLQSLEERPLSSVLKTIGYTGDSEGKNLFVTDFPGDVTASQVSTLREEVTAIIRNASPGDEAMLILQSGGGTVTGYGLSAAQLNRFKEHDIKLTICVEQVAASGGYMMCCVADKVIASPFAVLGSIGVISEIPNVYERLQKEGIEYQTVTAGEFKRTITPTKKVTKEDLGKAKDEIAQILRLFKGYVAANRPSLNIDEVATGETWFGEDALEKGLCDEIKTVDSVISEYIDEGFNVYKVNYDPSPGVPEALGKLLPFGSASDGIEGVQNGIIGGISKWLVRSVVPSISNEISKEINLQSSQSNAKDTYMLKDYSNASERNRLQ